MFVVFFIDKTDFVTKITKKSQKSIDKTFVLR